MGQHTWFYKDKTLFQEDYGIGEKLDKHETGEIWLDDMEIYQLNSRSEEINKLNSTNYHDVFRTSKRNLDGTYTDDKIYSQKECAQWLIDNKETVFYLNQELLNKFWEEFPNGVIEFG